MSTCEACGPPGKEWAGTTQGQEKSIGGVTAYFSGDEKSALPALLLIHDIYGFGKKNLRLLADKFAAAGYFVVVPDFFHGDPLVNKEDMQEWFKKHPMEASWKDIDAVLAELRTKYKAPVIGVEGFCWGGHFAIQLAGREKGNTSIQAAVIAHGSFVTLEFVQAARIPVMFLFSGKDDPMINADLRKQIADTLQSNPGSGTKCYDDMNHGWSLRGDDTDEKIAKDAHDAYEQALAHFKKTIPVKA